MSMPISGFTAIPNPQMLAFMGAQSFVMMYQAGEGWQYGKRRQSALSNEEFNKQTPESIMERQRQELGRAIPTIEKSMNQMTPMVKMIVEQYGDFVSQAIQAGPEVVKNIFSDETGYGLRESLGIPKHGYVADESGDLVQGMKNILASIAKTLDISTYLPEVEARRGPTTLHPITQQEIVQGPTEGPIQITKPTSALADQAKKLQEDADRKAAAIKSRTSEITSVIPKNLNQPLTLTFSYTYFGWNGKSGRYKGIIGKGSKTQTYRFDPIGHSRKYKQIIKTEKSLTDLIKKSTTQRMRIAYLQAIVKAYQGTGYLKYFR